MAEVISSIKPTLPDASEIKKGDTKTYKVRFGMTLFRKRKVKTTGNKVEFREETFYGDDPEKNEVDLTDHEALYVYSHQIEPLEDGTAELLASKYGKISEPVKKPASKK